VPQLGSQIYTMAGMTTRLNLQADHAGEYQGFSAQFSGDGFSDMRFKLTAVPTSQFVDWMMTAKAQGKTLDMAAYDALAHPSQAVAPVTYARVAPRLFETISARPASADHPSHQEH
jgi:cytochrome o ubiquinol oxidase subunit II